MDAIQKFNDILSQFESLKKTDSYLCVKDDKELFVLIQEFEDYKQKMITENREDDSLFVSKLHEKYIDINFQVFAFTADEHLINLFQIFEQIYPQEAYQIKKYWNVYSFSKGIGNILLKGDIQSGKTAMMVLTTLCYLVCNRDVIIILRTSNDDKIQFIERFDEIVKSIKNFGYSNKNFRVFDCQENKSPSSEHKYCFVSIYTNTKMKDLQKIFLRRSKNFILYSDEADLRDTNLKNTNFVKLEKMSSTSIFVSGTVQDIMITEWDIYGSNVVELVPNSDYKGIDKITWITDWDVTKKEDIYYTLKDISVDTEYERLYPYHPKIILVTTDIKIKELNYYYKEFRKETNFIVNEWPMPKELEDSCVIKYGDKGIRLYHHSFENQIFSGDFKPSLQKETEIIFKDNKKMTIKKVLLWLAQNGGKERFRNIIILAGKKADRGINFACYDPNEPKNNWHVTHQILHKASKKSSTKCATLIQSLRILGKFKDDIPLKVYTSEYEKNTILGSFDLTNELVKTMTVKDKKFYSSDFKHMKLDEICKVIPIKKSSISKNYIKKSIERSFHLVEDFEDGMEIENMNFMRFVDDEQDDVDEKHEDYVENISYKIISKNLPEKSREYYDKITMKLREQNIINTWTEKLKFIRTYISENRANSINNTTWNWIGYAAIVEENQRGLLFKKSNNTMYFRLNV